MRDIARFFLRYSRSTKQILHLCSLNRISGFAEDTPARQSKFCICAHLIVSLASPKILSFDKAN